jgi:tRNA pseudouridine-54 N-methylase
MSLASVLDLTCERLEVILRCLLSRFSVSASRTLNITVDELLKGVHKLSKKLQRGYTWNQSLLAPCFSKLSKVPVQTF